jgi:hypothetical protein
MHWFVHSSTWLVKIKTYVQSVLHSNCANIQDGLQALNFQTLCPVIGFWHDTHTFGTSTPCGIVMELQIFLGDTFLVWRLPRLQGDGTPRIHFAESHVLCHLQQQLPHYQQKYRLEWALHDWTQPIYWKPYRGCISHQSANWRWSCLTSYR